MSDRHRMHLVNGHRRTSPNGFTAAICRNVLGYYKVTDDPTKVTCKNGDRVALAAVHYFETRARGCAVMEPILKAWLACWGVRIR